MDTRLRVICFVVLIIAVAAYPAEESVYPTNVIRERRDVMDSVKSASNEAAKTLSEAGDAVVNVFKPTEKSVLDKMADSVKNVGQ